MSYPEHFKSHLQGLVRDTFDNVIFRCQSPEEMNWICQTALSFLNNEIACQMVIDSFIKTQTDALEDAHAFKSIAFIPNLLVLATKAGFDLYACKDMNEPDFYGLVRDELRIQAKRISSLSNEDKLKKIEEAIKDNLQIKTNHSLLAEKKPPKPSSERHVDITEQTAARILARQLRHRSILRGRSPDSAPENSSVPSKRAR